MVFGGGDWGLGIGDWRLGEFNHSGSEADMNKLADSKTLVKLHGLHE
jgi:hypothetical protein